MPVKLAELLRGNHLKPVYHSETGVRVLRELARSYLTIVEDQIRVMSRLKRCIAAGRLRVRGETSTTSGIGYRVFVCDNMAFHGDFTPVLAKHSKHFSLVDALAVGVDRMQRNFEPMRRQVEGGRQIQLTDDRAKLIIYRAFVEAEFDAPKHLLRDVHDAYFNPRYPEFQPHTVWSLTNAFTSREAPILG